MPNQPSDGHAPRDTGAAGELNALMRELYEQRTREATIGFPVLLHLEDTSLALHWRNRRWFARNAHEAEYLLLKDLVHVPLSLFLCFEPSLGEPPKETVARVRELLPAAAAQMEASALSEQAKTEQRVLLKAISAFLERPRPVGEFLRDLQPQLRFNIRHAAELRIHGLHRQVGEWRDLLGEAWSELRVVLATSHMARRDNLAEQYFTWLLRDEGRARHQRRVIKAEGVEDEQTALGLFGIHQVDSKAGEAFFNDKDYLHRDLLAPPVPEILAKLAR